MTEDFAARVVARARSYKGVPFVHLGREPKYGLDCIGLVLCSLQAEGWTPLRPQDSLRVDYRRVPNGDELLDTIELECEQITVEEIRAGDILSMRWEYDPNPRHIALVSEVGFHGTYIIHSDWYSRRVSEHRLDPIWKRRIVGAYRLKGGANSC